MILIVDDDDSVRELLRRVLVGEGYAVETAADGAQAVRIASRGKIELVLLDLNLPAQSGWETFERLTRTNPAIAFIIITARTGQLVTAQCAGASALLEKPLDFPTLIQTVALVLAEPADTRLARLTGRGGRVYYGSPRPKPQSKHLL